ncbi:MAG: TonB-dependent receptor [Pseudomonadota bacterium]
MKRNSGVAWKEAEIKDPGPNLAALDGAELPRAPNVTASAAVTWTPIEGFDATLGIRHVGSTASALGQAELDDYTVVDVSAGYEFALGGADLRADVFVSNLFDESYSTFEEEISPLFGGGSLSAAGRPRTIGASLTVRF